MINEEKWRRYVLSYKIEVPQERIEEELYLVRADMKHRMVYSQMFGSETHLFPEAELAEQEDAIMEAALFEAKEPLVLKMIIAEQGIEATPEELVAEGEALAERDGSAPEVIMRFFGDDYSGLAGDVRRRKAIEWACAQ